MKKIKCEEIYDNYFIELYLSNELDRGKVSEFEKHLDECDSCSSLVNDEKLILDSLDITNNKSIMIPPVDLDKKILRTISKDSNNEDKNSKKNNNIFSIFSNNPYSSGIAVAVSVLIMVVLTMSNDNLSIDDIYNIGNNNNNLYSNIEEIDLDLELENFFSLEEDLLLYSYDEIDSLEEIERKQDIAFGFISEVDDDNIDYFNYDDLNYYSDDENVVDDASSELEQELEDMYEFLGA